MAAEGMTTVKTEAAFTPGPWQIAPESRMVVDICHQPCSYAVVHSDGERAATEANARLIAASPRMYRQLEIFVSTIVNDALLRLDPDLAREADAALELLAEARGDAPSSKGGA